MASIRNNSRRRLGFGNFAFNKGTVTEVDAATLTRLKNSKVGKSLLAKKDLEVVSAQDVEATADVSDRDSAIRELFLRDDVEKGANGVPTVSWINKHLPQGMAAVDASERDRLWTGGGA